MHRGTSLKEQMYFGPFFLFQQKHCGLASCRFCSACVCNGTCFKKDSVNVPHFRTHLSNDVGTTTVSAVVSIALCSKVQSVKSCVRARVLACNMVTSEGYYTSQSMMFLHVSYAPFSTPPPIFRCHLSTTRKAVKLEFVQSVCYVRVREVGCLI